MLRSLVSLPQREVTLPVPPGVALCSYDHIQFQKFLGFTGCKTDERRASTFVLREGAYQFKPMLER